MKNYIEYFLSVVDEKMMAALRKKIRKHRKHNIFNLPYSFSFKRTFFQSIYFFHLHCVKEINEQIADAYLI